MTSGILYLRGGLDWFGWTNSLLPGWAGGRLWGHQRVRGAAGSVRGGGSLSQHAGRPPVRVWAWLPADCWRDGLCGHQARHLLQQGHCRQVQYSRLFSTGNYSTLYSWETTFTFNFTRPICRAGHATTLPWQRDHVLRTQNCSLIVQYYIMSIFVAATQFRHQDLNIFLIFDVIEILLRCV